MHRVIITHHFLRQLKKLTKKDSSLKNRLIKSLESFEKEFAISMGKKIYKLRIRKENKGKSGGYRIYVFLLEQDSLLVPIYIYAKSDTKNISEDKLAYNFESVNNELKEKWI